jgi:release factor glutamine methyltransferase
MHKPSMTVATSAEIVICAAERLAAAGIDSAKLDARVLLAHALGVRTDDLIGGRSVGAEQVEMFEKLVARRVAREPLAYITGTKEFFSLDFEVGPGVLIPRPETETLVEEAQRDFPNSEAALDVLDFGTGSGCLIIAFLAHYPNARGVGIDLSFDALAWAKRNLGRHGLNHRCRLVNGNWNATGQFDVVFSNPPYLTEAEFAQAAPEIRVYEPESAFKGGCDGLAAYRSLAPHVAQALKPDGSAFIEIGVGQERAIGGILEESELAIRRIAPDLSGISRCLVAGRRG